MTARPARSGAALTAGPEPPRILPAIRLPAANREVGVSHSRDSGGALPAWRSRALAAALALLLAVPAAPAMAKAPALTILKNTLLGAATGLVLGGTLTLVADSDSRGDVVRWGVVIGAFGGFALGVVLALRGEDSLFAAGEEDPDPCVAALCTETAARGLSWRGPSRGAGSRLPDGRAGGDGPDGRDESAACAGLQKRAGVHSPGAAGAGVRAILWRWPGSAGAPGRG